MDQWLFSWFGWFRGTCQKISLVYRNPAPRPRRLASICREFSLLYLLSVLVLVMVVVAGHLGGLKTARSQAYEYDFPLSTPIKNHPHVVDGKSGAKRSIQDAPKSYLDRCSPGRSFM